VAVADARVLAQRGRCSVSSGAYVGHVQSGGAAEKAGLRPGDVIVRIGERPVESAQDLEDYLRSITGSQVVPILYVRDGQLNRSTVRF